MSGKNVPLILPADDAGMAEAVQRLVAGEPVGVPTETVYGLAARADIAAAVAAIYRAKGRPDFNPLIVHCRDLAHAAELAAFDDRAERLAAAFWPGPLTMVLPLRDDSGLAAAVTAGLPTVALRVPAHPIMQTVLRDSGLALAAPSANASGAISPTRAEHVARSLAGRIGAVLDGGPSGRGLESTIVALRDEGDWSLLREGPISRDALSAFLGEHPLPPSETIEAPGQLIRHYAPGKPMRLNVSEAHPEEFLIGFGPVAGHTNLSASGDPIAAAARLYACLHEAAASALPRIAVAPVPDDGVGAAINDRLRRAAA